MAIVSVCCNFSHGYKIAIFADTFMPHVNFSYPFSFQPQCHSLCLVYFNINSPRFFFPSFPCLLFCMSRKFVDILYEEQYLANWLEVFHALFDLSIAIYCEALSQIHSGSIDTINDISFLYILHFSSFNKLTEWNKFSLAHRQDSSTIKFKG